MTSGIEVADLALAHEPSAKLRRYVAPSARDLSSVFGIVGTILLHAFALPAFVLGGGAHKFQPRELQSAGVTRETSPVAPAEALTLLTFADHPDPNVNPLAGAGWIGSALAKIRVSIPVPSTPTLNVQSDSAPSDDVVVPLNAGDPAQRALLFGRYTGQIGARIERAWMRPRSPIAVPATEGAAVATVDDTFSCTVQIRQDERGNVQEVLLLICNGTEAWRHSLVTAINQASPLPAPPTPAVFTRALTMTFEGHEYRESNGTNEYQYEPRH